MKRPYPLPERLILGLILLVGMALRLFRLGAGSLWYDETVSVLLAGSPLPELIRHTAGDIHPPGYYILLRGWLILTGFPTGHADPSGQGLEFAAGFFSLLFGVLLIPLAYVLARRAAGRRTALIAAALIAGSPYNLWYSQEVRMYTLGAGLGLLATYALWRATASQRGFSRSPEQSGVLGDRLKPPVQEADNNHTQNRGFSRSPEQSEVPGNRLKPPVQNADTGQTRNRGFSRSAGQFGGPGNRLKPLVQNTETGQTRNLWWLVYAFAAAVGMYTLYYFVFLLVPLNLWALWRIGSSGRRTVGGGSRTADGGQQSETAGSTQPLTSNLQPLTSNLQLPTWLLANGLAVLLYAPWIPIAWRQATDPPVPPWRTPPGILSALVESWNALSLGQSAPGWLWPALVLALGLYGLGLFALFQGTAIFNPQSTIRNPQSVILPLATFGPLALILLASLITPLYHVRYLFTYSPAFYVVTAAGLAWLLRRSRLVFGIGLGVWLAASAVSAHAFWFDSRWREDDHRAAVRYLQERWRPGDVVLVNAGWAYTALMTYWDGPIADRSRLTVELPEPRSDDALVMVTTGHLDGDPGLGWADPRSDFFALPGETARAQLSALFDRFDRVWHYRIYDTVNDPDGRIRSWLAEEGTLFEDQVFAGEANMRVQGYLPRETAAADPAWPTADFAPGLTVHIAPLPEKIAAGQTLYPLLLWEPAAPLADFATSVRLVATDGTTWAQGRDERPAGALYPASRWPPSVTVRQRAALPVPPGTPPSEYFVELVVYDPVTGQPWPVRNAAPATTPGGVRLGKVEVVRPPTGYAARKPLARFGPLALIEAASPVTTIAAGGQIPVELLWQAAEAPGEPLVVVVQLLDRGGRPAANLEEEPTGGRYPTQAWIAGELVRDRHLLSLPTDLAPGSYRLIVGVYRAADRARFATRSGLLGTRDYWTVKVISVQPDAE